MGMCVLYMLGTLGTFTPGNCVASAQGTSGSAVKLPISHSMGKILALDPDKIGCKNQSL